MSKTNIKGYFNPNGYDISLDISSLNLRITLKTKEWVTNKNGLVNDPILDKYVRGGCLSRSLVPKASFDVNPLVSNAVAQPQVYAPVKSSTSPSVPTKAVPAPSPSPAPAQASSPSVATPTPAAFNAASVTSNNPSVSSMSMADARKMKLVRPTRNIPEDYGQKVDDSQTGPIPEMMIAEDAPEHSIRKPKRPVVVPQQDQEDAAADASTDLIKGFAEAAKEDFEDKNIIARLAKKLTDSAKPKSPPVPSEIVSNVSEIPAAPAEQEEQIDTDLSGSAQAPVETAKPSAVETKTEEPVAPAPVVFPEPKLDETPSADKFVCSADGKEFNARKYLLRHVRAKYPDREEELMAAYPQ